tara:strand:- start:3057 stop:4565 length:1509 start_codon:yes stop_codon:yes gene_type:complete
MAFGLLGSVIPQVGEDTTLYVGIQSSITKGKVSICNKNYNPARIRLGYKDGNEIKYFEYNREVNYEESLEIGTLHLSALTDLVVTSDQPGVNFLLYGETISDTQNPIRSGILGQVTSTGSDNQLLFTAPDGSKATTTLVLCNLGPDKATARIGIANAGLASFDSTEYIEYNVTIQPYQTYTRPDLKLDAGQSVIASSSDNSTVSYISHGTLDFSVSTDDLTVEGNLGIGTTARPGKRLDVIGNVAINDGGLSVNGIELLDPTGGFAIGITSVGQSVVSGPIKNLNFTNTENTFSYDPVNDIVDIDTGSSTGVTQDDRIGCAFVHFGGFEADLNIGTPGKFYEIFSHEDAAVDIEIGVNVVVDEDSVLVITDKNTFDSFTTPIAQTNLLSAQGFKDNIRAAFDEDAALTASRKVGYVMIPSDFQDSIACDIEDGVEVSIGDMCVLNVGGGGIGGSTPLDEIFAKLAHNDSHDAQIDAAIDAKELSTKARTADPLDNYFIGQSL